MEKTKKIAFGNLPIRNPLILLAVVYLFLDKFNASGWVWGACGVIGLIIIIAYITEQFTKEDVDILKKLN